jgi:hypothetical protein
LETLFLKIFRRTWSDVFELGNLRFMRIQLILILTLFTWVTGLAQVKKNVVMPQIQVIGDGTVWRMSDNKDQHGSYLPPWREIKITNVFDFKKKPTIGNKVTVIPLEVNIAAFDLEITKAEKKVNECNDRLPVWWDVEFKSLKQKKFFEVEPKPNRSAQYPFEVAIVYPSVKFAQQLEKDQITEKMLPKGVNVNTVKAAIDFTNDQKPDALIVAYCCGEPRKSSSKCELTCSKTFKKNKNIWKLIDSSGPC